MKNRLYISCIICSLVFISCKSDDGNSFDRSLILRNQAGNIIIPAYDAFEISIDNLQSSLQAFSQNVTLAELSAAQNAWKEAKLAWKVCEVFDFGPTNTLSLETAFDRWPTNERGIELSIEQFIDTDDFLVSLGSNVKSLPALEYLLFHTDQTSLMAEFSDQANRARYALKLVSQLAADIEQLTTEWDNFQNEFITSIGNEASSSTTLLANEMVFVLELIKNNKLSDPSGIGSSDPADAEAVEAPHAEISFELIRQNIATLKTTFNGDLGPGFDDYLNALSIRDSDGSMLSEAINNQFDVITNKLNAYELTLKQQIATDPQALQVLIDEVQKQVVLLKVDMISQLGILLIFSDNDGD